MYREHRAGKLEIATVVRLCASLLLAVSLAAPAGAQWYWRHPQPQGEGLRAVDFTDALHGTAVGGLGTILTTTDGGKTWLFRDSEASQLSADLDDVSFADQANGLAVAEYRANNQFHSLILGTTDGGATWVTRETFPSVVLFQVSFAGDTAMVVGWDWSDAPDLAPVLLRSTDGGFTWERLELDPSLRLGGIAILDEHLAIATGAERTAGDFEPRILRTTDGGETWTPVKTGTSEFVSAISFPSPEIGIAVGEAGTILRTTDGGNIWTPQVSGTTRNLDEVSFSDPNNGAIISYNDGNPGVVLTTTDGGITWSSRPCEVWCFGIDVPDAGVATIVGVGGAILRTTDGGSTWEPQSSRLGEWWSSLQDVSFVNQDTATVVGGCEYSNPLCEGTILRTEDGGNTWVLQESGTMQNLYGVSFADQSFGIAVGGLYWASERVILRTLDGGDTWSDVTPADLPPVPLRSVYCTDANHCTAVGNGFEIGGSVIVRTVDGGDTWDIEEVPGAALEDVVFTDAENGTAVGGSTILHTTDGGTTWEPQSYPTGEWLHSVAFIDVDTGFAVGGLGSGGVLIKTADGGETWLVQEILPYAAEAIAFSDANHGAVATRLGHIFTTQDGGETWELERQLHADLRGVAFGGVLKGLAVGDRGAIYKSVGGPTFALGLLQSNPAVCAPETGSEQVVVGITVESVGGYSGTVALSTTGEPSGVTSELSASNAEVPGSTLWTLTTDGSVAPGRHRITVTGDDGIEPQIAHLRFDVVDPVQAPTLIEPTDGAIDVALRPTFTWEAIPLVDRYRIQVATDAAFEDVVLEWEGEGTSYTAAVELASDTQHFWRVQGTTGCAGAWSEVNSFVTRPQPLVEVTPEAVDFEVPAGGSDSATLTIANAGTGTLEWSVATALPPTVTMSDSTGSSSTRHAGTVALGGVRSGDAALASVEPGTGNESSLEVPSGWNAPELGTSVVPHARDLRGRESRAGADLASMFGRGLPSLRPISSAGGVVDCDTAPGLIVHDDGTVENAYSGDPQAGVTEVVFVDSFTPSAYPASFSAVCVAFVSLGPASLDFELVVFDDDGAEGGPGTELGALAVSADGLPDPNSLPQPVWFSYDISSLGVVVDSGSVYIGVRWAPSNPNVHLSADQSAGHPVGFAGGYWWNDNDGEWQKVQDGPPAFAPYRSMFIRAQENPGGCLDPSGIPWWLSVTPESGTSPAGGGSPVEIAVIGGLAGLHEASLCIATNDESRPLVVVPVRLVVTEGGVALTFEPSSFAFGDVDVGDTSPPRTALLENLGSSAATGLSFTAPGGDFEVDTSGCGDTLPGGGSCEVSVTFSPSEPGPAAASLTANSDQGPTASLDLAGNGIQDPPRIDLDPDSLSSTLGEGATETRPLTLANSGDLPLAWEIADGALASFARAGAITLASGEDSPLSAVVDPAGEFAYFGMLSNPGQVVKVDLATFERVGAITLETGENGLPSAVIDPVGEFAYFGTNTVPGRVVKIDLAPFERVGAITLASDEGPVGSAVIDPAGEFAYFAVGDVDDSDPVKVVKIDLATFERVGTITLASDDGSGAHTEVIDPAGEFAYFGMNSSPGHVVKVDLETFERVGAFTLASDEESVRSAVIDPTGEFAYVGTGNSPGRVVKIDLATFERVGTITLAEGENVLHSAVIDPAGEFAYFGTGAEPGHVVKVDLETFERVDTITAESGENAFLSAAIDPAGEFAYFAAYTHPGRVVKIRLRQRDCTLPDWVSVAPMSGSVPPDGSQEADVTFDAAGLAPGDFTSNLCVSSNDPDQPVTTVPLALTVTPPAVGLTFDPAGLEFGDVEVGGASAPLSATLHNGGVQAASELTFDLGGDAFTADTGNCGTSLPAGGSCTVSLTFAPTGPGPAAATLVASSAGGAGAELALAGNGVAAGVVTPTGLEVDPEELLSDGNDVFEPGEVVIVAPWWRNDGSLPKSLTGTASQFVGPDGVPHTVEEESASYGTLDPGQSKSCLDNDACYALAVGDPPARPATHWEATFDEALDDAADTGKTWTLHIGGSFTDVPTAHLFYSSIETLLHSGVTGGCVDDQYCPGGVNTRAQMPVFVLRALEGPDYVPPPCDEGETEFADVPAANPFCPWIEDLAGRGIVAGCGNDNYCPSAPVTRAQMAIFLLKTLEGADYTPPECSNRFDDVPCPSLFADWIEELAAREITGGCSANEYCPGAPVSRAQMAVFVTKTFGLTLYGP